MALPIYFSGDLSGITEGMLRDEELRDRANAESARARNEGVRNWAQYNLGHEQTGVQRELGLGQIGYQNRALTEESAIRRELMKEQSRQFGDTHSLRERELVGRLAEIDAERQARTEADYARMAQQERLYKMGLEAGSPEFNMMQYEDYNADRAAAQTAHGLAQRINELATEYAIDEFDTTHWRGKTPSWDDRATARKQLLAGVYDPLMKSILPGVRQKALTEVMGATPDPAVMRFLAQDKAGNYYADESRIRIPRRLLRGQGETPGATPTTPTTPTGTTPASVPTTATGTDARDRIAEDTVLWNNIENRPMNPEEIRASSPRSRGGSQYFPSNLDYGPITAPTTYGSGGSEYFAPTPETTGGRLPPPPATAAPESLVGSTGYVPGGGYFVPAMTGSGTPRLPSSRPVTGDQVRGSRIVPLTPGLPATTLVGGPNGEVAGIPNRRARQFSPPPPISEVPPEFSSRPLEFIDTQSWDRDSDAFGMITPPFRNPFPFSNYNTPPAPNSVMRVPTTASPDPTLAGNPRFPFRSQYSRPPTNQTMFPQETPPGVQVMRAPIVGTNAPSATNPFPFQPAPATNQVFMPHWSGRVKQYPGLPQWMYPPIDYRTVDPEEWIDRDRRQYVEPLPMLY